MVIRCRSHLRPARWLSKRKGRHTVFLSLALRYRTGKEKNLRKRLFRARHQHQDRGRVFCSQRTRRVPQRSELAKRSRTPPRIETLLVETGDVDFLRDKLIKRLSSEARLQDGILGSAALCYCLLADGTADGYIFAQPGGARTIDSPAGYLIAREAGCVFSEFSGNHRNVDTVEVGFDSKLDLVGASNAKLLAKLRNWCVFPEDSRRGCVVHRPPGIREIHRGETRRE